MVMWCHKVGKNGHEENQAITIRLRLRLVGAKIMPELLKMAHGMAQ